MWIVENSSPVTGELNISNTRKRAKKNPTYDFSAFYTTIPHNLLTKILSRIIYLFLNQKFAVKLDFQQRLYIGLPKA